MPERKPSTNQVHTSANWQKPLMPGVTKEYAKSTWPSEIARKEQDEVDRENTANGFRENK